MNKQRFIFLSLVSYIFLSGFLFEERGMSLPAPEKTTTDDKVSVEDDFPLIKIKAFPSKKEPKTEVKKNKHKTIVKPKIEIKEKKDRKKSRIERTPKDKEIKKTSNSNIGESLLNSITGIFKSTTKNKSKKPSNTTKNSSSSNRIKRDTKTQKVEVEKPIIKKEEIKPIQISTKYKSKVKRAKRRQTGHVNKLIFNKSTSLRDIPLPLPNLASLKLKSLIKSLPTIPVSKVPILNSIIPQGSKVAKRRLRSQQNSVSNEDMNNNKSSSKSLDMANIRIAKSNDYTTLIFDSYQWRGYNQEATEIAKESGNYEFEYEPKKNRIVAVIHGYTSFSALLGDQSQLFKRSDVIKNIYIDRYIGDDSIKFIIKLKKPIQMTVQNMKNPGRIILNLYPQ